MTSAERPSSTPSSPTPTATSVGGAGAVGDPTAVDGTTEVLPSVVQKVTAFSAREIPASSRSAPAPPAPSGPCARR